MNTTLALSASDGMALTMVAILSLTLGTILSMFWFGARNAQRKPDIENGLIEEEEEKPSRDRKAAKGAQEEEAPPQPWERDSDWWK